mmetsp:Transcript_12657/g.20559  ORF Transcript_12657/g.20559 Transcript_12657/m.20559 type:complete len:1601 (+) Transcript_12657:232-5034(+)|eukprot:CAMPEP_0114413578 /NCGR_PEP_ID=MMETSP0103-20121206/931_1 /TAXON_ID=37642 ORGANISM="Paraphysomonas imperforata, Strain PA2" /NCGR_SAMPLE_ID=MMETSP0103 /ASSEMBLY_ACC=CAM_ASM_000201 /LENGTH=1600 /DNA_ID=CAMNT_0001581665 /DNA_START=233 /DNA_END=5035 /DNA_ORIENTATION=+
MNNVSSFFDTTSERQGAPLITSSLSFDSLIIPEGNHDDDDDGGGVGNISRGKSHDFGEELDLSRHLDPHQAVTDESEEEEIKQIRTANLLQRTVYMELEKLKNPDVDSTEHPMLQGEVKEGEDSERLVTGDLRSKASTASSLSASSVLASVMGDVKFESWQEGFSLYLERSQRQSQTMIKQDEEGEGAGRSQRVVSEPVTATAAGTGIAYTDGSSASTSSSTPLAPGSKLQEKRPRGGGGFLFGDMNWSQAGLSSATAASSSSTPPLRIQHKPGDHQHLIVDPQKSLMKSLSEPSFLEVMVPPLSTIVEGNTPLGTPQVTPTKTQSRKSQTLDKMTSLELELVEDTDDDGDDSNTWKAVPGVSELINTSSHDVKTKRRDSMLRRAFTEFHNHTKTENASPFLGEDKSSHGGNLFAGDICSIQQANLEQEFKSIDTPPDSKGDACDDTERTQPVTPTPLTALTGISTSPQPQQETPPGRLSARISPSTSPSGPFRTPPRSVSDGTSTSPGVSPAFSPSKRSPGPSIATCSISSAHKFTPTPSTSDVHTPSVSEVSTLQKPVPPSKRGPRAREPCFLPMPGWRSFADGKTVDSLDMSAMLQSIAVDAWITPYIITASILLSERKLCEKQLTDISFQQDISRVTSHGQLSTASDRSSVESRSRSNSDVLMTVAEDVTLTNFTPGGTLQRGGSSRGNSPANMFRDPGFGIDIDDPTDDSDTTPPNSYLVNPFKYLNPFRNKSKTKLAEKDELSQSAKGLRSGVVRSSSLGDVPMIDGSGGDVGAMRRVVSHADDICGGAGINSTSSLQQETGTGGKAKLSIGQRLGLGNRSTSTDGPGSDQVVYGDLIVSHDEHGVYLSSFQPSELDPSGGFSPSNSSLSASDQFLKSSDTCGLSLLETGPSRSISHPIPSTATSSGVGAVPSFISALFLHPNCTDLGTVFACKNHRLCQSSTSEKGKVSSDTDDWEARRCFLWDNYLFELLVPERVDFGGYGTGSGSGVEAAGDGYEARPIGFINLSDALVQQVEPSPDAGTGTASSSSTGGSSGSTSGKSPASGVKMPTIRRANSTEIDTSNRATVVSVRFYTTAASTAKRRTVVLRRATRRGTLKLMQQLLAASRYTVPDLYDYDKRNETDPDLGTGRYSKCFKAVNKRTRRRVLGEDDSSPSGDDGIDYDGGDDEGDRDYEEAQIKTATATFTTKKSSWRGSFLRRRKKKKKKKKQKSKGTFALAEVGVMERSSSGLGGGQSGTADDTTPPGDDRDRALGDRGGHIHDGLCALKLVNKRQYWDRVRVGKERGDSLSREILAQSHLLNTIIAAANANVTSAHTPSNIDPSSPQSVPLLGEDESKPIELPIVQLYGIFETREHFVMEMELMQSIDLSEKLNEVGEFAEEQAKHIAIQLVQAVALCQVNGLVHRDIKLTNIGFPVRTNASMLPENASSSAASSSASARKEAAAMPLQIKVADFGMAGFVEKDGKLRGRCGTPGYVAPEILKAGKHEGYGIGVDMFSIGCVIYTLLCGYEPFFGETDDELIAANKSGDYAFMLPEWGRVSDEAKDFVSKLLDPFPTRRLTVHDALDHPWMAAYGGTINYPPKFNPNSQSSCTIS